MGRSKPTPEKIKVKQLRSFLGLSGWYRRFIDNFSSVSFSLTELLKSNKNFEWNGDAQKAFDKLKCLLTSAPILITPNFSKPFLLQCDASLNGLGCVLPQESDQGIELPVAFMSCKLTKAQRNYSVSDLECLAVVQGNKKFRPYIEGQEFVVVIDHASLQWLMRQRDLSGRLARWVLKLQGYSFSIKHRKGTENVVADSLSRILNVVSVIEDDGPLVDLNSPYFQSNEYCQHKERIHQTQHRLPDLKIVDQNLFYNVGFICFYRTNRKPFVRK